MHMLASLTSDVLAWNALTLYLIAAALAAAAAVRRGRSEAGSWWLIAAIMALLGLDQRLHLEYQLTDLLRSVAERDHVYAQRQVAQIAFILIAVAVLLTLFVRWLRGSRARGYLRLAQVGLTAALLLFFARTPSLHGVNSVLGIRFAGLRLSWLIEFGAIALVALPAAIGAIRRR